MRLTEPDLEGHQVVQLVPLLGHAGGACQQRDTLHQMPGARALQPKQADEHALRVANFRRVTYFDSSRERGERLRRISSAEVNVSDRSVGDRATRHVVRRQIDVETLPGHRQPVGERSQFGERTGKPVAREHRREPRHAEPLSQPLAPGQLHALPEVDDRLVVLARRVMNRAEAQDGGGASGDIAEPNTDVQGTPGCRERGGVVAYDQEGVGQSGRDAAQPFLVSEIPGTDLGGPVMLEGSENRLESLGPLRMTLGAVLEKERFRDEQAACRGLGLHAQCRGPGHTRRQTHHLASTHGSLPSLPGPIHQPEERRGRVPVRMVRTHLV